MEAFVIDVSDGRYGQAILPHYNKGRYYSAWIDFHLRIYNATPNDSGIYTFEAEALDGKRERQLIYVDISGGKRKKRKDKKTKKNKKNRGRKFKNKPPRNRFIYPEPK